MAIQDGDIKLLKSKVMDDVPEGGGGPTGQVVEWGKSNQIFDDVTEVARAGGQVSIRQLHAAVQTGSTDPLLDANIIIDQMPTDPNVSVTLAACDMFATRTQIAKAIADYQIAGTVWSGILLGNHVANQGNIQIFHRVGTAAPNIGATLVIVQTKASPRSAPSSCAFAARRPWSAPSLTWQALKSRTTRRWCPPATSPRA